jgi:hypothetical protein
VEFRNSGWSPRIPETPDSLWGFRKLRTRLQKLRKGSGVDGEARGSREKWKWIGSPLTGSQFSACGRRRYNIEISDCQPLLFYLVKYFHNYFLMLIQFLSKNISFNCGNTNHRFSLLLNCLQNEMFKDVQNPL